MKTIALQFMITTIALAQVSHLKDFQVIELRRYVIKDGGREKFARYFESYFPEAFEQLGAIAFGEFLERNNPSRFTWLRGFHNMDARAIINSEFYYGPLWREHQKTMNDLLIDSDDVLLLRPLHEIPVLPAVDPVVEEKGAQGIVVAQIFAVKPDQLEQFTTQVEEQFALYRNAGGREAGVLVTLAEKNNFPQLPLRTDGPYVVWIGLLSGDQQLAQLLSIAQKSATALSAAGFLRSSAELLVMDPAARSRLRWIAE